MEGTIKITAVPGLGVSLEMGVKSVSRFDVIAVFDALAQGFKLDDEERKIIGITFAMGGLNIMPGVKATALEVSPELVDLMGKMKGKGNNETAEI